VRVSDILRVPVEVKHEFGRTLFGGQQVDGNLVRLVFVLRRNLEQRALDLDGRLLTVFRVFWNFLVWIEISYLKMHFTIDMFVTRFRLGK